MRLPAVNFWVGLVAVATIGGCNGDGTGPGSPGGSDPVIMSGVLDLPQNPSGGRGVYISLAQGTIPRGATAQAINLTTLYPISGSLNNGGLDPIVVPAEVGDSIRLIVSDSSGGTREFIRQAKKRKPPAVVRADPPDNKTDVVLNRVRIIVVFSQPMDTASITSETVRLLQGGQPVANTTVLSADQTYLIITPATPLLPETSYTIVVTTGVLASDGGPLLQQFTSSFTTGAADVVTSVTIDPHPDTVEAGVPVTLVAVARDQNDSVLSGMTVSWSSTDPSVANVDALGTVRALAPGTASIIASVDGVSDSATIVFSPLSFVSVSAGGSHSCGVTTSGRAFCWGSNARWALGAGSSSPASSPLPQAVAGNITFGLIAAGDSASCGEAADGLDAYCWGGARQWDNNSGYFGDDVPTRVPPSNHQPASLASVSTGSIHACGLDQSGAAYCWGKYDMRSFQVFGGTWAVPSSEALVDVVAGGGHSCGLAASGKLECWGWNDVGQLGDGTMNSTIQMSGGNVTLSTTPVQSGVVYARVSVGRDHSCALSTSGDAYCWGGNHVGQLGGIASSVCAEAQHLELRPPLPPDTHVACALTPTPVIGNLAFTEITAGKGFTCGIANGGTAYCWGRNDSSQLGNATGFGSPTPVAVGGGLVFQSIDAGGDHACGRTTAGIVYCWGANDSGQLGSSAPNLGLPLKVAFQP